ncbi:hypothetical protein ACHAQA_009511 [Verticillium albo-atrum]
MKKADWKAHKKVCNKPGQPAAGAAGTELSPPKGLEQPISQPFTRINNGTYLHDRPETDVYRLLLDAYRLRMDDDYNAGEPDLGGLYGGNPDGLDGFQRFLKLAASREQLLPPWWTPSKQKACEELGMTSSEWNSLRHAVEKQDVIDHYGDSRFPMQLRMLAESVYGSGPGGADGTAMRHMMMVTETSLGGGLHATAFDANAWNRS